MAGYTARRGAGLRAGWVTVAREGGRRSGISISCRISSMDTDLAGGISLELVRSY
jgi:hypothetical protein